jgi:hypothetical protein
MRVRHIPPNLVKVRHEKLVRVRHVPRCHLGKETR